MQSTLPDDTLWLVSFADDDDRELTAEQIARALTAGEIVLTTIVWRDGMSDWKPIVEVPELRSVVQRQRIQRKRSTVMGMGGPGTPLPAPARGFGSPRPPAAAPAPFARTSSGAPFPPSPPLPAGASKGSPKGSIAGGIAAPRPAPPPDSEPDSIEDLGSSLLESVPETPVPDLFARGSSGHGSTGQGSSVHGAGRDVALPLPRPPMNTLPAHAETRTTLTGPGDFRESPPALDEEPISIQPDSLPPESLGSDALQSIAEQIPPAAPNNLFDIDSVAPGQDIPVEKESPRARKTERANERVLKGGKEESPPSIRVLPPEAGTRTSRGPAAPVPPRPVPTPAPQAADPLGDLDDAAFEEKKKGGFGGKLLIAALVVGFCAGAFYLGRQSAEPKGAAATAMAPEAPAPEVTRAAVVPEETAEAAPEETAEAAASAELAANEAAEPEESEPEAKPQSENSRPSSGARQTPSKPVELAQEPSTEDLPAMQPASSPATVGKPKEEEPEPESGEPAGPFDKDAAAAALARAASAAGACRTAGDPSGIAQVSVTFSPSGRATRAIVDGPPFAGTKTGGCIASKMRGSKIPSFTGSRVTVKKRVVIQ